MIMIAHCRKTRDELSACAVHYIATKRLLQRASEAVDAVCLGPTIVLERPRVPFNSC